MFDDSFVLGETIAFYTLVSQRIPLVNYESVGSSRIVGDSVRVTFRLYETEENLDEKTNSVFAKTKTSTLPLFTETLRHEDFFTQLFSSL